MEHKYDCLLPSDLLVIVFSHCSLTTLFNVMQTSRLFYLCANTKTVWKAQLASLTSLDAVGFDKLPWINYREVCRRFIQVFGNQVRNLATCSQCCSAFCSCKQHLFRKEIIAYDFGSESTWLKHCGLDGHSRLSMHPTTRPSCSCVSNKRSPSCDCSGVEIVRVPESVHACSGAVGVETCEFMLGLTFRRRCLLSLSFPDIPFVVCEPNQFCEEMRIRLVELLICHLKVPEVCFIPKPIAIALYADLETCLIVDSGANNTVITPVVNQRVVTAGVRHVPVGGSHLTRLLSEAVRHKGLGFDITGSTNISLQLKRECYIAHNIAAEARKKITARTLFVTGSRGNESHVVKVRLGHELYLAAENLYLSLDLPRLIVDSISTLSLERQRRLLANIVLSGGNSRLAGLATRLARDLQATLPPTVAQSVCVKDPNLMTGRSDAVLGASFIQNWNDAVWLTRRDFVLDGATSDSGLSFGDRDVTVTFSEDDDDDEDSLTGRTVDYDVRPASDLLIS